MASNDIQEWHLITHKDLMNFVVKKPSDFEPYGQRQRLTSMDMDCSSGCKYFAKLGEPLNQEWGICCNQKSPRAGLLTYEHQGCQEFSRNVML